MLPEAVRSQHRPARRSRSHLTNDVSNQNGAFQSTRHGQTSITLTSECDVDVEDGQCQQYTHALCWSTAKHQSSAPRISSILGET
jgi:hypothetical protein